MSPRSPSAFPALLARSRTLTSEPGQRVCHLGVLPYHHLHLLLRFTSVPRYRSHGTFAVTEIMETGFLCVILFCYGLLSFASWRLCNVKARSKYTQTLQKEVSSHDLATLPGQLSEYVPFYTQSERQMYQDVQH